MRSDGCLTGPGRGETAREVTVQSRATHSDNVIRNPPASGSLLMTRHAWLRAYKVKQAGGRRTGMCVSTTPAALHFSIGKALKCNSRQGTASPSGINVLNHRPQPAKAPL